MIIATSLKTIAFKCKFREKVSSSSATLPKPEQKKPDKGTKLASHSSFSKFEEKRLRQSETKTKANLLKFSVFKKATSTTDEQDHSDKRTSGYKIPSSVNEGMKRDFRARFPTLPSQVDRDSRVFAHTLITDVVKCAHALTIDELSERVQIQYQRFMKHMETSAHFASVDADTRELLMDFVEKHAMSYLHELPSMVFSPHGTEDERLDRLMFERIQQLGWVGERHLECKLDRSSAACRRLLYKAISELLGMDSALYPGAKLIRARRACRHVLALCTAPASADDLLPALIFTVLKANPPRLISNINFVTRFCNAQRLMTGEGGYYFTNLCCAVSFIENLNAESLNMDKKEFDCYMAMPASIGGSAWAAALSLCGAARSAETQRGAAAAALRAARDNQRRADLLATNAIHFKEQIAKKVADVLSKTPLEIKPRRELPRLDRIANIVPLLDLNTGPTQNESDTMPSEPTAVTGEPITNIELVESNHPKEPNTNKELVESNHPQEPHTNIELVESNHPQEIEPESLLDKINAPVAFATTIDVPDNTEVPEEPKKNLDLDTSDQSPAKSPHHLDWDSKQNNSMELLTPSPLGFTPFDSRSLDELMTPDEFGDHLAPGLSNINYDIDLSDFSGDNSIAEDAPKVENDPFSPEGLKTFDPFAPQADSFVRQADSFAYQADSAHQAHPFVHQTNSSTHQADSFRHQADSFPLQAESFSHQADSFSHHADSFSHQADSFTHRADSSKHQADSFTHQADSFSRHTDPFALKVDPFAPQIDPFSPQVDPFQPVLQAFDEFSLVDSRNRASDPFQMVPKARDPFSPIETTVTASPPERHRTSILDDSDSPTAACLLPSPLLPQSSGKQK